MTAQSASGPLVDGVSRTLDCSMVEAEERIRAALGDQGFGVLTEIDVAATLKDKIGVERAPMKILGACNPVLANEILGRDDSISLLLPCNVVLDETAEGVRVRAIDPIAMLPGDTVADLAETARAKLTAAIAAM